MSSSVSIQVEVDAETYKALSELAKLVPDGTPAKLLQTMAQGVLVGAGRVVHGFAETLVTPGVGQVQALADDARADVHREIADLSAEAIAFTIACREIKPLERVAQCTEAEIMRLGRNLSRLHATMVAIRGVS